jgi:hypothetical protein
MRERSWGFTYIVSSLEIHGRDLGIQSNCLFTFYIREFEHKNGRKIAGGFVEL